MAEQLTPTTLAVAGATVYVAWKSKRKIWDYVCHLLLKYRGIFCVFVVMPVSLLFDAFWWIRGWYIQAFESLPHLHQKRVEAVQQQVRSFRASGSKLKMCTARPSWMTISMRFAKYKTKENAIHVDLHDVLGIDEKRRVVRVEPLVSMGQLSAYLVSRGWTLEVLPEMDDLTVGGLFMGFGIETSSHKYGLFQDIVEEVEVVLADGSAVSCSATKNIDLFRALPWSYGTLGFMVSCELRIIPCKRYVDVTYIPCYSQEEYVRVFSEASLAKEPAQFVESLVFDKSHAVVMLGNFSDGPAVEAPLNAIGRFYKPWFFEHVRDFLKNGRSRETIPLRDYYHRHTRSMFWELRDIVPFGNNPVFRYLLGWMMPPKVAFLKLTQTENIRQLYEEKHVDQDMLVPLDRLSECIDVFHRDFRLYPLWLCPHRVYKTEPQGFLSPSKSGVPYEMYVDVGAYGPPAVGGYGVKNLRRVEAWVSSVHGYQALYADTYLSYPAFRDMFDHTLYEKVRTKYEAEKGFPEVYDKVKKQ